MKMTISYLYAHLGSGIVLAKMLHGKLLLAVIIPSHIIVRQESIPGCVPVACANQPQDVSTSGRRGGPSSEQV